MASIRTAGLTKNFGDLGAVNEIDLDLPEGGVAGFVGPNGAFNKGTIRMLFVTEPNRLKVLAGKILALTTSIPAAIA
jgi:ABC-2 type transport system ATP-binding protein